MGTAPLVLRLPSTALPVAFNELYERFADLVYRAALRVTGSPSDAEDALQTVFLRLWNREDLAQTAQAPEAYFRRAAVNAAVDVLRRRSRRAERPPEDGLTAPASSPILKEQLRRAIAQLPARDAELFTLRYIEGISNTELAAIFGMDRITIGTRLHRIRQVLQESLGE